MNNTKGNAVCQNGTGNPLNDDREIFLILFISWAFLLLLTAENAGRHLNAVFGRGITDKKSNGGKIRRSFILLRIMGNSFFDFIFMTGRASHFTGNFWIGSFRIVAFGTRSGIAGQRGKQRFSLVGRKFALNITVEQFKRFQDNIGG